MRKVILLEEPYEGVEGTLEYINPNEGYPVAKIKLDTGDSVFMFLEEFTYKI